MSVNKEVDLEECFEQMLRLNNVQVQQSSESKICCSTRDIIYDYKNGSTVCRNCGVVDETNFIDESAEWTFGGEESVYGKDPSRCGMPTNEMLPNSSISTKIQASYKDPKFKMLNRIHEQTSMDYKERARYHVFERINKIGIENGNLPIHVVEKAKYFYMKLAEKKLSRGNIRKGLIACCVMYACKEYKICRSVKEISIMSDVDVSTINTTSKTFFDFMKEYLSNDNETCVDDLTRRFCSYAGIQDRRTIAKISNEVTRIHNIISSSGLLTGKTPSAITSSIMFYVINKMNLKQITKKLLCEKHNISVVTLNKIHGIIVCNEELFST
tara:strand:- start:2877 stop:3857 length:981 start_codon:yes stop_codon:yes gene_type:complete